MSDYLPDLTTLYILGAAIAALAGSLGLGMLFGAMISAGGSDRT